MASNNSIIYLAIMVHGTIYGNYDDEYNYSPAILEIPPEFDYVNKITKNVRGSVGLVFFNPETGENQLYDTILSDLSNLITTENIDNNKPPIVGQQLLTKMRSSLDSIAHDYHLSKTYDMYKIHPQPNKVFDKHLPLYSSIDTTTTNQYINKLYSKDMRQIRDSAMDIFVLYQKDGPLNVGDKLLETIYNAHHSRLRRSAAGIIRITLNDILYFLYTNGYKNVVLIDFSCESCLDAQENILPSDTTHIRRVRRSLKGFMGGRTRRHKKHKRVRKTVTRYR